MSPEFRSLRDFFLRDAVSVASELIGWRLLFDGVGGTIVETEAYRGDDEASHSFRGETRRNAPMFGPPAHAYIYRSYGLHWCLNFVCQPAHAVLIRAIAPDVGIETMMERRGTRELRLLCSGPGRLSAALGIGGSANSLPLDEPPFQLSAGDDVQATAGQRIGISKNTGAPWRFTLDGSPFVSRRMP